MKNLTKHLSSTLILIFLLNTVGPVPTAHSQQVKNGFASLPSPGAMMHLSPSFTPAHLQGLSIHPDNALQFDFLIQPGDEVLNETQKKQEYNKLVKYFLASLTIPDTEQWVNLSPYEKNRIIKDNFGTTEMGRDLLAQDYILKQITSSLIYPEEGLGKKFWDKIYERAWQEYGTTNIPVNTFNKVWIIPDEAAVYESGNTVVVLRNHLKVMLEGDYLAMSKNTVGAGPRPARSLSPGAGLEPARTNVNQLGSQIIREIILPELEREVNEGKNFANLRQIYSGMILATWYKQALKESLLGKVYADRAKTSGIGIYDVGADLRVRPGSTPRSTPTVLDPQKIYTQYLAAFKKGVFNYIKDDVDKYTNQPIPRKYFSGGARSFDKAIVVNGQTQGFSNATVLVVKGSEDLAALTPTFRANLLSSAFLASEKLDRATVALDTKKTDKAMSASEYTSFNDFIAPIGRNAYLVPQGFINALHYVFSSAEVVSPDVTFAQGEKGKQDYDRLIEYLQRHQEKDSVVGKMYRFFLTGDAERTRQRKVELGRLLDGVKSGFVLINQSLLDHRPSAIRQLSSMSYISFMNNPFSLDDPLFRTLGSSIFIAQRPIMVQVFSKSIERNFQGMISVDRAFFLPLIFPSLLNPKELDTLKDQIRSIKANREGHFSFNQIWDQTSRVLRDPSVRGELRRKLDLSMDQPIIPFLIDAIFVKGWDNQQEPVYESVMKRYEEFRRKICSQLASQGIEAEKISALNRNLIDHRNQSLALLKEMQLLPEDFDYEQKTLGNLAMTSQITKERGDAAMNAEYKKQLKDMISRWGDNRFVPSRALISDARTFMRISKNDIDSKLVRKAFHALQSALLSASGAATPDTPLAADILNTIIQVRLAMETQKNVKSGEVVLIEEGVSGRVRIIADPLRKQELDLDFPNILTGHVGLHFYDTTPAVSISKITVEGVQVPEALVLLKGDSFIIYRNDDGFLEGEITRKNRDDRQSTFADEIINITFQQDGRGLLITTQPMDDDARVTYSNRLYAKPARSSTYYFLQGIALSVVAGFSFYYITKYQSMAEIRKVEIKAETKADGLLNSYNFARIQNIWSIDSLRQEFLETLAYQYLSIKGKDAYQRVRYKDGFDSNVQGLIRAYSLSTKTPTQESINGFLKSLDSVIEKYDSSIRQITIPRRKLPDARIKNNDKAQIAPGGIDLNSANLNLQIKRDGKGVPLPLAQQDMSLLNNIEGFIPIILEIKPILNLPILTELHSHLTSVATPLEATHTS